MNYVCSVSDRFPENYRIGVEAGVWGVEERHAKRIKNVEPGVCSFLPWVESFAPFIKSSPYRISTGRHSGLRRMGAFSPIA